MSTNSPEEQLANKVRDLQSNVQSLQEAVRLSKLREEVEALDTTTRVLEQRVSDVRARGYAFGADMEGVAADLASQWEELQPAVLKEILKQGDRLTQALRPLEMQVTQMAALAGDVSATQSRLNLVGTDVHALQGAVEEAKDSIKKMYEPLQTEVDTLNERLQKVDWMLGQFAEATFQLLAGEAAFMAVSAEWTRESKDEPKGVLYLTDQRVLFEQKQDIATKKLFFITTEKQHVHQLLLEIPIEQIASVQASKRGLLGHEDHLDVTVASGAPVRAVHFHLDGQDSIWWQDTIRRAKGGDLASDR